MIAPSQPKAGRRPRPGEPAAGWPKFASFTLVEMLVVMAVLVILIALLLPSLRAARETGKSVQCVSNLHQIGVAILAYTKDNDGLMPWSMSPDLTEALGFGTYANYLNFYYTGPPEGAGYIGRPEADVHPGPYSNPSVYVTAPYHRKFPIFKCPSEKGELQVNTGGGDPIKVWTMYDLDLQNSSYAYSWWVNCYDYYDGYFATGARSRNINEPPANVYNNFLNGVQMWTPNRGEMAIVMDCPSATAGAGGYMLFNTGGFYTDDPTVVYDDIPYNGRPYYQFRHRAGTTTNRLGYANALFLDGHVAGVRPGWLSGVPTARVCWDDLYPRNMWP